MPRCSQPLPPVQLTWFTQPYITRLRYERPTDTLEATTLTLLSKPRTDRFHLADVRPADTVHPLTSFAARGRLSYLDADNFSDMQLLARLVPHSKPACVMLHNYRDAPRGWLSAWALFQCQIAAI